MKAFLIFCSLLLCLSFSYAQNIKEDWSTCTNETGISIFAQRSAIDQAGNTYITGFTYNSRPGIDQHYFLIKYNTAGTRQWIRRFSAADSLSTGSALGFDFTGDVFVTGYYFSPGKQCNMFVIKYNPAGTLQWRNNYRAPKDTLVQPGGIYVTPYGNLAVIANESGYLSPASSYRAVVWSVDSFGKPAWITKTDAFWGNAILIDANDNVIAAGGYSQANDYQLQKPYIVKYNRNGKPLWSTTINDAGKYGRLNYARINDRQDLFFCGYTDSAFFYNPHIITTKFTTGGERLWLRKEIDSTYNGTFANGGLALDNAGNAYITGAHYTSSGFNNWITTRYTRGGIKLWTKEYFADHGEALPAGIAAGEEGVYVAGSTTTSQFSATSVIVKYNKSGTGQYIQPYSNKGGVYNTPVGIEADESENIYLQVQSLDQLCAARFVAASASLLAKQNTQVNISPAGLVYPNPAADILHINTSGLSGSYTCAVYNAVGQKMLSAIITGGGKTAVQTINVQHLSPGLYVVDIFNAGSKVSARFVKQ